MESKDYTPTIPANDLRFSKPYESSFVESQKAGETKAYFQSCNIDYDCAEDICRASSNMASHKTASEEILMKYGKERAERVVAIMINNAPTDKYSEHREWAAQIGNGINLEPSARNIEIFQRHEAITVFHIFIQTFRRIADSMINTLFTTVDKGGNEISKPGWAFPKEFTLLKAENKSWDKGLSVKERLAVAEQMAAEYSRNRQQSVTHKNKRSNGGLDL